jgi:hypothetical protein
VDKRLPLSTHRFGATNVRMSHLSAHLLAWPRPLMAVAVAAAALMAAAVALWVHYGTAVFYEMIAAGVAWCL